MSAGSVRQLLEACRLRSPSAIGHADELIGRYAPQVSGRPGEWLQGASNELRGSLLGLAGRDPGTWEAADLRRAAMEVALEDARAGHEQAGAEVGELPRGREVWTLSELTESGPSALSLEELTVWARDQKDSTLATAVELGPPAVEWFEYAELEWREAVAQRDGGAAAVAEVGARVEVLEIVDDHAAAEARRAELLETEERLQLLEGEVSAAQAELMEMMPSDPGAARLRIAAHRVIAERALEESLVARTEQDLGSGEEPDSFEY